MMKRHIFTLLFLFQSVAFCYAQAIIDDIESEISRMIFMDLHPWKVNTQMRVDAQRIDFDDADWKTLDFDERIYPDSAWLRNSIVLPQQILGKSLKEGGTVKLVLAVDDGGICWINGENKGQFDWNGEFILTNEARPGQRFVVAIKAINTGGPLRILSARLQWEPIQPFIHELEDYLLSLKVGRKLLSDDTYLQVGRVQRDDGIDLSHVLRAKRLQLRGELEKAARLLAREALKTGDSEQFLHSLERSRAALKPIG
ncbi:MAG: hypothetical protein ACE5HX_17335, partial [bacterium]